MVNSEVLFGTINTGDIKSCLLFMKSIVLMSQLQKGSLSPYLVSNKNLEV